MANMYQINADSVGEFHKGDVVSAERLADALDRLVASGEVKPSKRKTEKIVKSAWDEAHPGTSQVPQPGPSNF